MSVNFNEDGGLEVSPGPRGFSVVGVELSADGSTMYLLTDQPGTLNGVRLPIGPRGPVGEYGDPGEARIRVDETVGYRVFLWDTATAGENMIYGDTGTRQLSDGTTVRRTGNVVERTGTTTPAGLGAGFAPAVTGGTVGRVYVTGDAWPATLPGTEVTPPRSHRGLEGYSAAIAQGYPGTAEEWMNMVYRVVLPAGGATGQVLTRTAEGSAFRDLPRIGPGSWVNITLAGGWTAHNGEVPSVRLNNGTVEMIGEVRWTGASRTAGVWGDTFVHIGNVPPAYAPEGHFDTPARVHMGDPGAGAQNYPIVGRVDVNHLGQIYLGAFGPGLQTIPIEAGETQVNIANITYPLRNS